MSFFEVDASAMLSLSASPYNCVPVAAEQTAGSSLTVDQPWRFRPELVFRCVIGILTRMKVSHTHQAYRETLNFLLAPLQKGENSPRNAC